MTVTDPNRAAVQPVFAEALQLSIRTRLARIEAHVFGLECDDTAFFSEQEIAEDCLASRFEGVWRLECDEILCIDHAAADLRDYVRHTEAVDHETPELSIEPGYMGIVTIGSNCERCKRR